MQRYGAHVALQVRSQFLRLLASANATILSEFGAATQHESVDASAGETNRRGPGS